ncbi:MAG: hypothetical protein DI537_57900 [Stutzerimonas stutzeri]|nr:MAG: hypothetical protein DI537_57900 [Stutzerimonas stutzeri]
MRALQITDATGSEPLKEGAHEIVLDFEYDGGGAGKGGNVRFLVGGKSIGSGRVENGSRRLLVR